jgi:hypothetical protein
MSNPLLNARASIVSVAQAEQTFIEELPAILGTATVMVDGVAMNKDQIIAVMTKHLSSISALTTQRQPIREMVATQSGLRDQVLAIAQAVKASVAGTYGPVSTQMTKLGLAPAPRNAPTAATVALAAEKRRATREERGTKGKRQKAAIHGTVSAAPATPPAAPTADKPGTGNR